MISETARALKPGGFFLFDTINRTLASKLLAIKEMQEWRLTRFTDVTVHKWAMFIKPEEWLSLSAATGCRSARSSDLDSGRANPSRY